MEKNKETVKQELKQQALLSWFRTWLWLYLEEKRDRASVARFVRIKPVLVRLSVMARFGIWLKTTITRPFRAWKLYQYARLPQAEKERVEDLWLARAYKTLYGNPPKTVHAQVTMPVEDRQEILDSDFVKFIQGDIT